MFMRLVVTWKLPLMAVVTSAALATPAVATAENATPTPPTQTYITMDAATGRVLSVTNYRPRIDYARPYQEDAFPAFGWWKTHIS